MGIASDFVLIVVAGLLGGIAARMLGLPLLVGYVAAGVFVGPNTMGPTVAQIHDIELLAEIGVALLLFSIGLEVSFRDLQAVQKVALAGGGIQVAATCAIGAWLSKTALGMGWTEALWWGAMISVSSTTVVLKALSEGGVTSTLASRVMIGLLVFQDLAVIPMLIVLPQLGAIEGMAGRVGGSLAVAGGVLAAVYFLGTRLLPRLLRFVLRWGSRELFLVSVVAIGVGVGYATHSFGISFALGAFVAGIILSESEFSHQALSDVVPLRDIFGLLFFVSVGMLFDPRYALANAGKIATVVVLIVLGKALILGGVARGFGYQNNAPWLVGLGLSQIGEFSFVLARTGLGTGQISKETYDLALTSTVVTMALSPLVSRMALPLGRMWREWRKPGPVKAVMELPKAELSGHVIVGGWGRSGKAVARALQTANVPAVIVESNYSLLADLTANGFQGVWGDITGHGILRAAQIERARMLVLTMPDANTVRMALKEARRLNGRVVVMARAAREHQVAELRKLGVEVVVQPEFEGGLAMVREALADHDREEVARIVDGLRVEMYGIATGRSEEAGNR